MPDSNASKSIGLSCVAGIAAGLCVGCDVFHCGSAFDVITISGLLTLTASTGESVDSYYNFHDDQTLPEIVEPAVRALGDLDGDDHAFDLQGIHIEQQAPNHVSRGLRFKLRTPLLEGDQFAFNVDRSASGDLADPPALGWTQFENRALSSIPLVSASAMVTDVDPLVLAVELEAVDGRLGRGDFEFRRERMRNCD